MSTSTPSGDPDQTSAFDLDRLDRFVARAMTGSDDAPVARTRLSGGMSQTTIIYRRSADDPTGALAVRIPPLEGPLAPYAPAVEAGLLRRVAGFGIPAPDVALTEDTGDVIGRPFYATRFLATAEMSAHGAFGPNASATRMAEEFVDQLAAIHAVPLDRPGLADASTLSDLLASSPGKSPAAVLQRWTEAVGRHELDVPAYQQFLWSWLSARQPETAGRRTLVHGDYRLANMLWAPDSSIAAVMDWEESGIGDPYLDLAWMLMGSFEDDDLVYGLASRGWILERYAERTGTPIDEERLLWWEVAAGWMLLCMNALAAYYASVTPSRDMRPLLFCYFNRRIAVGYLKKIQAYETSTPKEARA